MHDINKDIELQAQLQSVEYMLPLIKEFLAGHGVEIM